jgi:hypothetical protein
MTFGTLLYGSQRYVALSRSLNDTVVLLSFWHMFLYIDVVHFVSKEVGIGLIKYLNSLSH